MSDDVLVQRLHEWFDRGTHATVEARELAIAIDPSPEFSGEDELCIFPDDVMLAVEARLMSDRINVSSAAKRLLDAIRDRRDALGAEPPDEDERYAE